MFTNKQLLDVEKSTFDDKPKSNKKVIVGMIALALIIALGLSYIVYSHRQVSTPATATITEDSGTRVIFSLADPDTDNDGLSDKEEEVYGTNPNSADSDNDGFSDLHEINNFFDPLGEGSLNEVAKKNVMAKQLFIRENIDLKLSTADIDNAIKLCQSIDEDAYYFCLSGGAQATEDYRYCLEINDDFTHDRCLLSFTTKTGKGCGCEFVKTDDMRVSCDKATGQANLEKTDESDHEAEDFFYLAIADANKNPEACYKIFKTGDREDCFTNLAKENNNIELCKRLDDDRDECACNIAKNTGDPELCEQTAKENSCDRDDCLYATAVKNNDTAVCTMLSDLSKKDSCYQYVAFAKKESGVCGLISSQEDRSKCFYGMSQLTRDPSLCVEVIENEKRDACYLNAAIASKDTSQCVKISNADTLSECFARVASYSNNYDMCSTAPNEATIKACYDQIIYYCDKETEKPYQCYNTILSSCKNISDPVWHGLCVSHQSEKLKTLPLPKALP